MINVNYTYYSDYFAIYTNIESVVHLKLMLSVNYTSIKKKRNQRMYGRQPRKEKLFQTYGGKVL